MVEVGHYSIHILIIDMSNIMQMQLRNILSTLYLDKVMLI